MKKGIYFTIGTHFTCFWREKQSTKLFQLENTNHYPAISCQIQNKFNAINKYAGTKKSQLESSDNPLLLIEKHKNPKPKTFSFMSKFQYKDVSPINNTLPISHIKVINVSVDTFA